MQLRRPVSSARNGDPEAEGKLPRSDAKNTDAPIEEKTIESILRGQDWLQEEEGRSLVIRASSANALDTILRLVEAEDPAAYRSVAIGFPSNGGLCSFSSA